MKKYRTDSNCLNCGSTVTGKFCSNCGQENLDLKESFWHMLTHSVADYFHFDSKFFKTMKPLFFKPGFLTNEYNAGRRTTYLHPIRMYIFISIIFFLFVFSGNKSKLNHKTPVKQTLNGVQMDSLENAISNNPNLSASQKAQEIKNLERKFSGANDVVFALGGLSKTDTTVAAYTLRQKSLSKEKRDNFLVYYLKRKELVLKETENSSNLFYQAFISYIPKMMFLLLPLFALLLKVTFSGSKKYYAEHFIYALHLHSFLFLYFLLFKLIEMVVKLPGIFDWLFTAGWLWYIYRSLKTVYHNSRAKTIWKMMGMFAAYSILLIICLSIFAFITFITI